jgi:transcriptional regulator with XRE-family HTH domain
MRASLRIDNGDMSGHEQASELGAFLKACRARVQPGQAGLVSYGDRRRVAGLRREELALLAGVSSSYYSRLEQGQSRHASPEVLDAIAAALALDPVERQHLHVLAESAGRRRVTRPAPIEQADPALIELLDAMPTVPAIILGRHSDVLAWNPMGHALLLGHLDYACVSVPGRRPNLIELVFLDPDMRALFADWPRKARAVVGNLRLAAGPHPGEPTLAALIDKLIMTSPEFGNLWADQTVQACYTARYELRHPLIGDLTITQQTLRSIQVPDQTIVTCTAPGESAATAALSKLAHIGHPP